MLERPRVDVDGMFHGVMRRRVFRVERAGVPRGHQDGEKPAALAKFAAAAADLDDEVDIGVLFGYDDGVFASEGWGIA